LDKVLVFSLYEAVRGIFEGQRPISLAMLQPLNQFNGCGSIAPAIEGRDMLDGLCTRDIHSWMLLACWPLVR
jgi:predicted Co/Zn/Cd cation transporter (cation efflux family)